MKVLAVFGTRPEAIKMCPIIIEMKKNNDIECKVCLTGQHKEMLSKVMETFEIQSDYNFEIMKEGQSLSDITCAVLKGMDEVIAKEKPDLVLVHGDTTTSFAAGLAAFYHGIRVGHVEAGLRTNDIKLPFPEEFNRQAVDLISDLYFAPTENAKRNLLNEGKKQERVFVTGNTVIDALKFTVRDDYKNEILDWSSDSRLVILTTHRRENIGKPMCNIFHAVNRLLEDFKEIKVVFPIHPNPKVREIAHIELKPSERLRLIEPLDVMDFHNFMDKAYLIMSDSGGVQEEAPSLGVPVVVLRNETERPEGVEANTLVIAGTEEDNIYKTVKELLTDKEKYNSMKEAINPYGDGKASERIVGLIKEYYAEDFSSVTNL